MLSRTLDGSDDDDEKEEEEATRDETDSNPGTNLWGERGERQSVCV